MGISCGEGHHSTHDSRYIHIHFILNIIYKSEIIFTTYYEGEKCYMIPLIQIYIDRYLKKLWARL